MQNLKKKKKKSTKKKHKNIPSTPSQKYSYLINPKISRNNNLRSKHSLTTPKLRDLLQKKILWEREGERKKRKRKKELRIGGGKEMRKERENLDFEEINKLFESCNEGYPLT